MGHAHCTRVNVCFANVPIVRDTQFWYACQDGSVCIQVPPRGLPLSGNRWFASAKDAGIGIGTYPNWCLACLPFG